METRCSQPHFVRSSSGTGIAAPKLPAFDVAVLLLFLSELSSGSLPLAVACSEAVALSIAYGSDEAETHRHVNGLLGSYARERM